MLANINIHKHKLLHHQSVIIRCLLTYGVQQIVAGVVRVVQLQDSRQPRVQFLLILRHYTQLLLSREQRYHMLLLQIQSPRYVVATLQRHEPARGGPRAELLLRLVVFQARGTLVGFGAQNEILFLHGFQLSEVALAHYGAARYCSHVNVPASQSRARRHTTNA